MKDDYLWDRSGEADPEVQKLEELLGTLRYQPQPLAIPADLSIGRRRSFYPLMAIAAGLALLALGFGMWTSWKRVKTPEPTQAKVVTPDKTGIDTAISSATPLPAPVPRTGNRTPGPEPKHVALASYRRHERRVASPARELTAQELADKEQVMFALRLVSAKLSFAQRKSTGLPGPNVIRNQHRIG